MELAPVIKDGRTDRQTERPTDRRTDRRTEGWKDGWMDGPGNRGIEVYMENSCQYLSLYHITIGRNSVNITARIHELDC